MENYIFERILEGRRIIESGLSFKQWGKATHYHEELKNTQEKLDRCMGIKTMPQKYRDELNAILSFCWNREILNHILYPVIWEGRLYSKWDKMPEECREAQRNGGFKLERTQVFNHKFKEGMRA